MALFRIKWRDIYEDNYHVRLEDSYHIISMQGSVNLLRSTVDPTDYKLFVSSTGGETFDIHLPYGVDWNVTYQTQELNGIHAQMVELSYIEISSHRKVKILIGLPCDPNQRKSLQNAKQFCDTIILANLQSGVAGIEQLETL